MRWTSLVLALMCFASPAAAQGDGAPTKKSKKVLRTGPYLGVQPGTLDVAPNKKRAKDRRGYRQVTWVGFQMVGQGGRVFVQTTSPAAYTLVPGKPDEVIIDLPDARLHRRNDGRKLETGFFPTAVAWVDAEQMRGNTVRVTIKLREVIGYDLRQEGNYLFFDFRPPTRPVTPPTYPPKAGEG